jgi:hypothetical protein
MDRYADAGGADNSPPVNQAYPHRCAAVVRPGPVEAAAVGMYPEPSAYKPCMLNVPTEEQHGLSGAILRRQLNTTHA